MSALSPKADIAMPKLIKKEKIETHLGTTYRFYVRGMYFGAAATRARALEAAKKVLAGLQDHEEEATGLCVGPKIVPPQFVHLS
jgi:hypothetical protein